MRDMTDAEYDALDERLTNTIPTLGPNGTGFFSSKRFRGFGPNENSAQMLNLSMLCADPSSAVQI
jgi:hypothetical protein